MATQKTASDHGKRSTHRPIVVAATVLVALSLGACSDTASNLLSTGSLTAAKPAAAKAITPTDRMLQVAALSARAQKCGYSFDPVALRANFLASETGRGLAPEAIAGLGQRYDYTQREIANRIRGEANYCDDNRVTLIRADLNRHLRGDYSVRVAKRGIQKGLFETDYETKTEMNPDFGREADAQPTRTVKVE